MKKTRGFTLFEILLALAIVGILSSLAISTYSGYIKKARYNQAVADIGGISSTI